MSAEIADFLAQHHPFDALARDALQELAGACEAIEFAAGADVYRPEEPVRGLYVVRDGQISILTPDGTRIAQYGPGEGAGARPLLRGANAENRAVADVHTRALLIPAGVFTGLIARSRAVDAFYDRARAPGERRQAAAPDETGEALLAATLAEAMTRDPVCVAQSATLREAAAVMDARHISCVLITDDAGALAGILTTGDVTGRVVAAGVSPEAPVAAAMTRDPLSLPPGALVLEALTLMSERGVGHLPVVERDRPVGILTRTNLVSARSLSAAAMIGDIAGQEEPAGIARIVARAPQLLAKLVGMGVEAHRATRIVTGVADAATRRLLALAERTLGPPPRPYLWLACGSQGRQEMTGAGDQDNCLILADGAEGQAERGYFEALAQSVTAGLDRAGYVFCPGDMMASNARWRQPVSVWRGYFRSWIDRPEPMAQMLASVMFDLRPIAGETALFAGLQRDTLRLAKANSIFRAHMIANALKHTPPLTVLRGFALIRSGEHKDTIDLKHNGVAPIVDLARVYALEAGIEAVNTRERLVQARAAGVVSASGGEDLIAAYDLIAQTRLEHQARLIRAGERPDNFLAPAAVSALTRNHLRDAFAVVKSMQAALSQRSA